MSSLTIVADENIPAVSDCFSPLGTVRLLSGRSIDRASLEQADILLVRSVTQVNQNLLEGTPVKFVGSATIGTDHLDIPYLKQNNIVWANAPGSNARSVVEYVLSVFCRVDGLLDKLLNGTQVGIIGMGNVGSRLYHCLKRLGIDCVAYDPLIPQDKYAGLTDLGTVLKAKVICLHTPMTQTGEYPSHHMISPEAIQQLPADTVVINAGRGGVINQCGLSNTLSQRPDLQMILDVWENEPEIDTELLSKLTLASPHIAGYSLDGKWAGVEMIQQACYRFFNRESQRISPPHTTAMDLSLKHTSSLTEGLREAILSVYDIAADDQRLRESVQGQAVGDIASNFDRLRRDYPVRREFSKYQISNHAELVTPLKNALAALDFKLNV